MKRNDLVFLFLVALYSFLFYRQSPGLNFLIFSAAVVAAFSLGRTGVWKSRLWILSAALVLISGTAVYLNGSVLSIMANVSSLMLFSVQSIAPGTSVLVSLFLSMCSLLGSYVFAIIDYTERRKKSAESNEGAPLNKGRVWVVLVSVIIVVLFFVLYRSSNLLFKDLTKYINLDWVSWKWVLFTTIGAFVVYGLLYVKLFGGFSERDRSYVRFLAPAAEGKTGWGDVWMSEENERFMGVLLLSLLNLLVFFVNGSDLLFLFGESKLPAGVTYTDYVHQGVGLLIINVLLAMVLVLYFFRGRLNYNRGYKILRILAVVWLLQNVLMLVLTAQRNNMYTEMFGMTYKRIGVYFYLLLTIIGLLTTAMKVVHRMTNGWLFRMNSWLFFMVFVFSSLVSWSRFITWYSLNRSEYVNRAYLTSLSEQAIPYLVDLNMNPDQYSQKDLKENYEDDLVHLVDVMVNRTWGYRDEFSLRLYRKIYTYLAETDSIDWRSQTWHGNRVRKQLLGMNSFGKDKVLNLEYAELDQVKFYKGFSNIQRLNLSNNKLTSAGEIARYPALEELILSNNQITSVAGLDKCPQLKYLDVRGNTILDFDKLAGVKTLKKITGVYNLFDPSLERLMEKRPDIEIEQ